MSKQIMDDYDAGFQAGLDRALFAVRNVDRQIKAPKTDSYGEVSWKNATQNTIYHAQKDLLYKIYAEIKKQKGTNENL